HGLIERGSSGSRGSCARHFARRYAQVCLPPLLTLLTRYGVALEAHGENTVLAIRGGLPVRCIVRDFGGVRIHRDRLAKTGLTVALRPGSATETSDADQLRNKLYYALFVNDLTQLVRCLSRCSGESQASLWRPFGSVAHETFTELAADPTRSAAATADRTALLEKPWPNKALLTMWLRGDVTDYTYLPITNPFASEPGGRR
ncbi:MAG: IucA/IucC family C-terminal-domain containing protein, partial [Mycobacteriales bacterium]